MRLGHPCARTDTMTTTRTLALRTAFTDRTTSSMDSSSAQAPGITGAILEVSGVVIIMAVLDSLDAATMAGRATSRAEHITVAMRAESRVENFTAGTRSMVVVGFTVVADSTVAADPMVDAGND